MIRDVRMMARAIQQRWGLSPEYRSAVVGKLMRIVADPNSSDRAVISAAKALISMEAQNQSDEQARTLQHDRNRFLEIAEQLGFDTSTGYITEGGTDSDTE